VSLNKKGQTMKKLLLASMLVLTPQMALALEANETGAFLLEACKMSEKDTNDSEGWLYSGFCLGVFDTWIELPFLQEIKEHICSPPGLTVGQGRMVFIKYAENHPERLHEDYHALIWDSFLEAWPC